MPPEVQAEGGGCALCVTPQLPCTVFVVPATSRVEALPPSVALALALALPLPPYPFLPRSQDVFDCAQREYMDEGVPWSIIEYNSNSKILELLEGKMGVLALLNEECMLPKVGSDGKRLTGRLERDAREYPFPLLRELPPD